MSKSRLMFFLFLATGAITGGLMGHALEASQFFGEGTKFLVQKYQVLNIAPATVDFYLLQFSIGFVFQPNLVSILGIIIACFLFNKM
ncbi:MAG: DUF4321 domain-containing protein [Acidaminococcaceae bacterium]